MSIIVMTSERMTVRGDDFNQGGMFLFLHSIFVSAEARQGGPDRRRRIKVGIMMHYFYAHRFLLQHHNMIHPRFLLGLDHEMI